MVRNIICHVLELLTLQDNKNTIAIDAESVEPVTWRRDLLRIVPWIALC